ncbi:MAG TPA: hypothetical protein VFV68_04905, partial [Agriterribacter sp.]|nr:hypothetical protein [Agriterribacter sp.]
PANAGISKILSVTSFIFLEESLSLITFAATDGKNNDSYKTHKETFPEKEGLKSVLCDRIYSRPFRNRKGFFNESISKQNNKKQTK